ncbi:MAG TPA: hypothetical protein VG692_02350, partial [Gemmatimonadales bacterium]|nr:hypothetical protein [Gemmatimonadales bacterium]
MRRRFLRGLTLSVVLAAPAPLLGQAGPALAGPRFDIRFPVSGSSTPVDGRLLLVLSNDTSAEPRFQIGDIGETQLIFGIDVEGWAAGKAKSIDTKVFGYPIDRLSGVPAGRYRVQALLNR